MNDKRAATVLQILRENFAMPQWTKAQRDPFETLIVTIISQNTADRNTARAFESLSKRFEIKPEVLANAETSQIEDSLKTAGLYRNKAKTIKQVSRIILEKFHGSVQRQDGLYGTVKFFEYSPSCRCLLKQQEKRLFKCLE